MLVGWLGDGEGKVVKIKNAFRQNFILNKKFPTDQPTDHILPFKVDGKRKRPADDFFQNRTLFEVVVVNQHVV